MSTSKWGQRSSSAIIWASFIIKETPLEASFYGFYKDKQRKFWAILAEILPQLG